MGDDMHLKSLIENLLKILNLELEWGIALVRFGNLGHAFTSYNLFLEQSFIIRAIFDNDTKKIGGIFKGKVVSPIEHIEESMSMIHTMKYNAGRGNVEYFMMALYNEVS